MRPDEALVYDGRSKAMKSIAVFLLGWLVPGLGHIVQKKYGRGFTFFVCILAMTGLGLWMAARSTPSRPRIP